MSSAGPAPPPHRYPVSSQSDAYPAASRPSTTTDRPGSSASTGARDNRSNGSARPHQPYPHLKDLVRAAESRVFVQQSIGKLLEQADSSLKTARASLDWRRPDQAFVEYLVASQIVVTEVPRHRDVASLHLTQRLHDLNSKLRKSISQNQQTFDKVRDLIKEDNQRYDTKPRLAADPPPHSESSLPHRPNPRLNNVSRDNRPSSVHIPPSLRTGQHTDSSPSRNSFPPSSLDEAIPSGRDHRSSRPPVKPKPPELHGNAATANGHAIAPKERRTGENVLEERFSRLRMAGAAGDANHHRPDSTPAAPKHEHEHQRSEGDDRRPKVSIQTSPKFPKPPSPTYTPGRENGSAIQPPRSLRSSEYPNSRPGRAPSEGAGSFYDSDQNSDSSATARHRRRRKSINPPREKEISARRLYDYLQQYNILLIDVRSREEYDAGHIFANAGMCVEPTALRSNMSAEELQDALVLSPEEEQDFFYRRDEFDLVVYYDQSTISVGSSDPRVKSRNPAMRYLQEALYDYNQEKPLQWAPILLLGGLDAWIDLMGNQALQTSTTAQRIRGPRRIARRPVASGSSRIDIQKRRRREYNPLKPEEEQKWRERARSESMVLDSQPLPIVEDNRSESPETTGFYEDFQRRYPDVSAIEQQTMKTAEHAQAAREPPRIPHYPTPPIPSQPYAPTVPSRPPPAVARPSYSGVSERVVSQSTPAKRQLAPYIPPKLKRLPRTGLHNFSVTCYMNATIQCLSASLPMTAFFLDGEFHKYLQKDNWKGSKGLMPELYSILLRNLWQSNDVDTIRPTNFRSFCARLNKEWGLDRQQDAKEFLDFLVDCLHEDFNVNWRRNPLRPLTTHEEAERERTPYLVASRREWDRYLHRDNSRIQDLFAGQHISRLQCATCETSSTTWEAFTSISVEIPPTNAKTVDIRDCLQSYCSAETLAGDEVWRCPRCKCEREATKRITITRAPEFLVVHFKRFRLQGDTAQKIHTPVDFPLKGLNLEPYMLPLPDRSQLQNIGERYGAKEADVPSAMLPPYTYDAYAVMRHLGGTMGSGHYIALVQDRARGCWREFNDDRVTDFRPGELSYQKRLQNECAYIVFFQRSRGANGGE